jgi:putative transposase
VRFGVSRSGYYAWRGRPVSSRLVEDRRLTVEIAAIFAWSEGTYGSPRIHAALRKAGIRAGRKRVARIMREGRLKARSSRLYRRMPGTKRFFGGIPNRVLDAATTATNQIWVGDVTYLRSADRWRYLAVVMDRHSRRVIGWRLGAQRDLSLTLGALDQALARRRPPGGLVFHSDRGVEYSAYAYRKRLNDLDITQSMKRPRELGDNAFIESFFGSMKADVIHGVTFEGDNALRHTVGAYIRRYNRSRLHSSLGYRSPIDFERQSA